MPINSIECHSWLTQAGTRSAAPRSVDLNDLYHATNCNCITLDRFLPGIDSFDGLATNGQQTFNATADESGYMIFKKRGFVPASTQAGVLLLQRRYASLYKVHSMCTRVLEPLRPFRNVRLFSALQVFEILLREVELNPRTNQLRKNVSVTATRFQ